MAVGGVWWLGEDAGAWRKHMVAGVVFGVGWREDHGVIVLVFFLLFWNVLTMGRYSKFYLVRVN